MWSRSSSGGDMGVQEGATMKAVVVRTFGPPAAMKVETVPVPTVEDGEVLVHVLAAGVNPVDTYIRSGKYAKLPQLPYTPGAEGAGEVIKVGRSVTGLAVGDRVYMIGSITGTYAQYTVCVQQDVRPLPPRISFQQGAAISVAYRTAYRALFQKSSPQPGDTVLIHGASGGVGLAAVQLAAARGLQVFGTASTDVGLQTVSENGAVRVFDHSSSNYVEEIQRAAPATGIRLIVEMLANMNLNNDLMMIGRGGRIAIVGNRGEVTINPRLLMQKESTVVGVLGGTREEWDAAYAAIEAGLACGALTPRVGKTFPLNEAGEAHIDVMEHAGGARGKVVLEPWPHEQRSDGVAV